MRIPEHPTLIRRMLQSRLKKIGLQQPVLAATFVHFENECSSPSCPCHQGGPKHPTQHVTYKEPGQKTRSVYVPKDLIEDVKAWIQEHHRLKRLLQEINQLTLALIRTHAQHKKRQKGRT